MSEQEPLQDQEEYDYNREPPLDRATSETNRGRSKYVFMTLCFLLALVLFYVHINGTFESDGNDSWFPLVGAIVLTIVGLSFLFSREHTSPPTEQPRLATAPVQTPDDAEMPLSQFEQLIQEALATIPAQFHEQMDNVMVRAAYEPGEELLTRMDVQEGQTLLGLYEGIPLTSYGRDHASYPEIITIYQRPIEAYCQHDPERIRAQVRATVLHEVAHHFGMGHAEMPIWVK